MVSTKRLERKPPKPWYKSITLWVNLISAAALAFEQCSDLMRSILPEDKFAWVAFVVALVNIYLRLYVSRPLYTPPMHPHSHDHHHDHSSKGGGDSGISEGP